MRWKLKIMVFFLAFSCISNCASAEEYDPKAVRIVEINGVRLYMPELWIWPARPRPEKKTLEWDGIGFDSSLDRSHVFVGQRLWIGFVRDKSGKHPDWSFYPQLRPSLLPHWLIVKAYISFPKQPLPYDASTPIPPDQNLPDLAGSKFYISCDANVFGKSDFDECWVARPVLPSLQVWYRFHGSLVPKSEWLALDIRVQKIIEWLALPPSERSDVVDY